MQFYLDSTSPMVGEATGEFLHLDGLVQERRNSTANALELRLSCTKPSIYSSTGATELFMRRIYSQYFQRWKK